VTSSGIGDEMCAQAGRNERLPNQLFRPGTSSSLGSVNEEPRSLMGILNHAFLQNGWREVQTLLGFSMEPSG